MADMRRKKMCEDCRENKSDAHLDDDPISGGPMVLCDACYDKRKGFATDEVDDWGEKSK